LKKHIPSFTIICGAAFQIVTSQLQQELRHHGSTTGRSNNTLTTSLSTATLDFRQHHVQVIIIDPAGDLTIRLYEELSTGEKFMGASGKEIDGRILATMEVSRLVRTDNSPQFERMLRGNSWRLVKKSLMSPKALWPAWSSD
jgi:hypothetical protein